MRRRPGQTLKTSRIYRRARLIRWGVLYKAEDWEPWDRTPPFPVTWDGGLLTPGRKQAGGDKHG